MLQELRRAVRSLAASPGSALAAVAVVALGVGASAAAFSLLYGVLIRPLPYAEPERILKLWESNPAEDWAGDTVADGNFLDWRSGSETFSSMAAYLGWYFSLTGEEGAERVAGLYVSEDFFPVLGVPPALGRSFAAAEASEGADVVVLSHALWQRRYGGAPDVVGRRLVVNGSPHVVTGVMPAGFVYPSPATEMWSLVGFSAEDAANRSQRSLRVIGRLAAGVSVPEARAEMATLAAGLAADHPETNRGWGVAMEPLQQAMVGEARPRLLALGGAVACLMLLACVNLAGMLMARTESRLGDVAIRKALGAGAGAVLRSPLVEGLLLSLVGAGVGLLLARWCVAIVSEVGARTIPRLHDVRLDAGVVGFALGLALLTGLLAGTLPAWRVVRRSPLGLLGGSGSPRQGRRRIGRALVVIEVALSLTLLVGAGLLARSLWNLSQVDTGFDGENVLTLSLSLSGERYRDPAEVLSYFSRAGAGVRSLPGVVSAGWTSAVPLTGGLWKHGVIFEDRPEVPDGGDSVAAHKVVDGYLETVGLSLSSGRLFTPGDGVSSHPVVVVNRSFAERYYPGRSPIGQRIKRGQRDDERPWKTIVGVVADERHFGLTRDPEPEIYEPHRQQPFPYMSLVVRTVGDPLAEADAVRAELLRADPQQPVYGIKSLAGLAAESIALERTAGWMLGFFALLSLLLAGTGLYGLLAVAVDRRRHEIGVRMALGAGPGRIRRLVLAQGMGLVVLGAVVGLLASVWATRLISGLLYGVDAADWVSFSTAAVVLLAAGWLACYVPVRRALDTDPSSSLRA